MSLNCLEYLTDLTGTEIYSYFSYTSKGVSSDFCEDSKNFYFNHDVWYLLSVFEAYGAVYRCVIYCLL